MGTQAGFDTSAFGPFAAIFDNYVSAIESFGQGKLPAVPGFAPAFPGFDVQSITQHMTAPLKATARCQLEVLGLVNRRTQAVMQMPTRLAQCRTPQDFVNEQMAFWRTATEQYRESAIKIGQAWGQALPWAGADAQPADRDYITFNGSKKDVSPQAARPDSSGSQRRVA